MKGTQSGLHKPLPFSLYCFVNLPDIFKTRTKLYFQRLSCSLSLVFFSYSNFIEVVYGLFSGDEWICIWSVLNDLFIGLKTLYTWRFSMLYLGLDSRPIIVASIQKSKILNSKLSDQNLPRWILGNSFTAGEEQRGRGLIFRSHYLARGPFAQLSVSWKIRPMGALSVP